jgi:hypothetical protein
MFKLTKSIFEMMITFLLAVLHPIAVLVGIFGFPWFFGSIYQQIFHDNHNFDINKFIPNSIIIKIIIFILFLFFVVKSVIKSFKVVQKKNRFVTLVYVFCLSGVLSIFIICSMVWFANG